MALWLMYELKRWGYLKKEADFKQIAESVFLATDARKHMLDAGVRPAKVNSRRHAILGKDFDPEHPEVYFNALPAVKQG
jgi:nitrate/nitrite transport system substrate-binding protein